jgi:gliding motility-associated protein GldE
LQIIESSGFNYSILINAIALVALLFASAFISGSEVAFFSLTPSDLQNLNDDNSTGGDHVAQLIEKPRKLLATILIGNNFVNIAIVLLSTLLSGQLFDFSDNPLMGFLLNVVGITFLLLLFGEVLPKVYASRNALKFSMRMAMPISIMEKLFNPLSEMLMRTTRIVEKRLKKKSTNISVEDLSTALDITENEEEKHRDKKILKRIINFGNTEVTQIMKPRVDVMALEIEQPFSEVLQLILDNGYSRIPVYRENFDQVAGLLYIKDLIPHLEEGDEFDWQKLIRPAFFVPESKKLDDLLREFQIKKVHMAIVVDEYGGASGIVTMEDVLEEILGDISDEFDDEDVIYSKLDDSNYVFEGKILLKDFYRIINIEGEEFEIKKGEAETLAGFVLEISGRIPNKNDKIQFANYTITVESVDKRRIKRIKVTIEKNPILPLGEFDD